MIKNGIVTRSQESSAWISKEDSGIHVMSVFAIESDSTDILVESILNEFDQTAPEDKIVLKIKIEHWINSMPTIDATMENRDKLRDFIYEMF